MLALGLWLASGVALAAFAEQPDKWVRYVEATGSQYVDTGITGRYGTKAECKVEWMAFGDCAFLAARNGSYGEGTNGRLYFCYCLDEYGTMFTASDTGNRVVYNGYECRFETNRVYTYVAEFSASDGEGMSTNTVKVDGKSIWSSTTNALNTGRNLYLFANNQKGTPVNPAKARCYGLKIWQDNALVRDFQPCMKDGRAGLYDAVSGDIFYSASGTDLVCDEHSEEPDEFIDYIESQGSAAKDGYLGQLPSYIDTGVIGRDGTKASGEFAFLANEDTSFLDARSNDGDTRIYLLHNYYSKFMCGYKKHIDTDVSVTLGEKYWFETALYDDSQYMKVATGGVTNTIHNTSTSYSDPFNTGLTLYLFACNYNGNVDYPCKGRCYGLKIWQYDDDVQDDILVRDFRPCLKNGVAGLYDNVTKRIFYSQGTPFSYETRKAVSASEVLFVEYIESDGNNTLDTYVPALSGTRAAGEMSWVGALRSWYREEYQYLEDVSAVFFRQQRAYLASVKVKPNSANGVRFFMLLDYDADLIAGYGEGSDGVLYPQIGGARIRPAANEKYSFDVTLADGSQTFEWNGGSALNATVSGTVDTGNTLHLFSSSFWRNRSAARCYGLKIWQGGELVRDFRPCVYANKGMLYDTVTGKVYRPSPDIPASRTGRYEEPAAYVEYVESDGSVFVDTGVIGKSGTKLEGDFAFCADAEKQGVLAACKGNTRFYPIHNYWLQPGYGYGDDGTYVLPGQQLTNSKKYRMESELRVGLQSASVYDGGVLVTSTNRSDSAEIDTGLSLYLFARNNDGVPDYGGRNRCYWFKLWQGDADGSNMRLVRSFMPVRLKNGLVVLWDLIEKKPYPAQAIASPGGYVTFSTIGPDISKFHSGLISIFK